MKKILVCVLMLSAFSCKKRDVQATIIKDCTGSYLSITEYDYKICNTEMVDAFESGTVVKVDYRKVNKCEALDSGYRCEREHAYEKIITIKKLKLISK